LGKNILFEMGLNDEMIKIYEEKYGDLYLGRVTIEHKGLYRIITENGEVLGKISGKLQFDAGGRQDYPAVGDWVVIDRVDNQTGDAIIMSILPRKNKFSRKMAGKKFDEQIIAANIDVLFICMSLNNNFNLRRLERYIALAWDSMTVPVILLTKSDLCMDIEEKYQEVVNVALGIDILEVSVLTKRGLDDVKGYIKPGITLAFIGSSGVGKSTLVNELMGEGRLEVQDIGKDDKGRHTTTHRELMLIPTGGVLIDTPGMREIHLLDGDEGVEQSFSDIEELGKSCRYSDCSHEREPGCAVHKAINDGELTSKRLVSYMKLKREAEYMERKINKTAEQNYKKQIKKFHKSIRDLPKKY